MNTLTPTGRPRDTEFFGDGDRYYFFDVIRSGAHGHYLAITRSDRDTKGKGYRRSQIIVFQDDLYPFIEALGTLLGRFSTGHSFKA